jgi:hypothetical protein
MYKGALPIGFLGASRLPLSPGSDPRSLRSGVNGWDRASIPFEALLKHMLVGVEAGCDEEMLLRFSEQDVMIRRLEGKTVRLRRMSENPVRLPRRGQNGGTHDHRVPWLSQKTELDRPEE